MKKLILFFVSTFYLTLGIAKAPLLWGKILDQENKLPIAYASVYFKNHSGVFTNEEGLFTLSLTGTTDTVFISHIGYFAKTFVLPSSIQSLKHVNDTIFFELKPRFSELVPVVIGALDADKILAVALTKTLEKFKIPYSASIKMRNLTKKDDRYTFWSEATGEVLFLPSAELMGSFSNAFRSVKSCGETDRIGNISFGQLEILGSLSYMMPWQTDLYDKKLTFQNGGFSDPENIIQVVLTPKSSLEKSFNKIEKNKFLSNIPPLFTGVKRSYWVNLKDSSIIGLELISQTPSKAEYDHNNRMYSYRRYFVEFNENATFPLTRAFAEATFSIPKSGLIFKLHTELYTDYHQRCDENEEVYAKRFGLEKAVQKGKNSVSSRWTITENSFEFFADSNKWLLKSNTNLPKEVVIPKFLFSEKALNDLKQEKGIEAFK